MNRNYFFYKLNNYDNPYLSLVNSIENTAQDGSVKKLFEFIQKNTISDINEEKFNFQHYRNNNGESYVQIFSNNILHELSLLSYKDTYNWIGKHPFELFNTLYNFGLDFTKESRIWNIPYDISKTFFANLQTKEDFFNQLKEFNIIEDTSSTVFDMVNDLEERNICLLGLAYKQMPNENFQLLIQKYSTLHKAVAHNKNKLIKFLIEDCHVEPNIRNNDYSTPLLFCHNFEVLTTLNNYDINWFAKNVLDKDCITMFTSLSDKEKSKLMVDFAQKRMAETFNQQQNNNIDPEYLKKRIKQNLLEMVKLDKTKKELEDFIKKYKIKDFSDIFDENGNSLAQLCIKNNNWARYSLFKSHYPSYHVNNFNQGNLEHLFTINVTSHINSAKQILNELLQANIHEKNNQFTFNIFLNCFDKENVPQLPTWYFEKNAYSFAKHIIGEDYAKEFCKNIKGSTSNVNVSQYSRNPLDYTEFDKLKNVVYFYLTHMSLYNENVKLNEINIESIFSERNNSYNNTIEYDYAKTSFATLIAIIDVINEHQHLHKFDTSELWNRFEQKAVEHIVKDYHMSKNKLNNNFILENENLINVLIDKKSDLFKSILNQDFVDFLQHQKELFTKVNFMLLSQQLSEKNNSKKTNKI